MRPVSEATARVTNQSFSRKYIALGRIVKCWSDIVGADLATKAQPVKIHYRKNPRDKKKAKIPEAVLHIAASSADATLLHYQSDLILERINQIFGERWISGIRFVANPSNATTRPYKKKKRPLTAAEKNHLSDMLDVVSDEEIRKALGNLGQAIIAEEK